MMVFPSDLSDLSDLSDPNSLSRCLVVSLTCCLVDSLTRCLVDFPKKKKNSVVYVVGYTTEILRCVFV